MGHIHTLAFTTELATQEPCPARISCFRKPSGVCVGPLYYLPQWRKDRELQGKEAGGLHTGGQGCGVAGVDVHSRLWKVRDSVSSITAVFWLTPTVRTSFHTGPSTLSLMVHMGEREFTTQLFTLVYSLCIIKLDLIILFRLLSISNCFYISPNELPGYYRMENIPE